MTAHDLTMTDARRVRDALTLWAIYLATAVLTNGTIPFMLGADMRGWTASVTKDVIVHITIYAGLFLVIPLILTKGRNLVLQAAFLIPLLVAVAAISIRPFFRPSVALVVFILAYLHRRYDLSELGIRSHGWRSDVVAVLFLAGLNAVPGLLRSEPGVVTVGQALLAGLDRWFANPASTTETLFYFGFLTERLSRTTGRWLTPVLIGLMYTAHEMTNPEYWYEGLVFGMVFVGVAVIAALYLWRRSTVVLWLGDGLGRALGQLF
jgi:hypothetical protein